MNLLDKCKQIYLDKGDVDKHRQIVNMQIEDSGIQFIPNCSAHIVPTSGICSPEEFFKKYETADSISMNRLKMDLHNVMNDILWIKEAGLENTGWAIDFVDSLNTLSTQL